MKKLIVAKTRWEYYVSNIAGLFIIVTLISWCLYLSFDDGTLRFSTISFWVAAILTLMVPFAIISFFSAMKSVVVNDSSLTISYLFKNHKNHIAFSEVKGFQLSNKSSGTKPTNLRASFTLILNDGRVFEFSRSQFDNYDQLLSCLQRYIRK